MGNYRLQQYGYSFDDFQIPFELPNYNESMAEALKRIGSDLYGVCEESEEAIGFKRLKAQPWTRYSLEAQKEFESRQSYNRIAVNDSYPSYSGDSDDSDSDESEAEE
jgi:hypothetical protein